jgi:hypothetical protein
MLLTFSRNNVLLKVSSIMMQYLPSNHPSTSVRPSRSKFIGDSLAIPARYNLSVDKLPLLLMLSEQPIG